MLEEILHSQEHQPLPKPSILLSDFSKVLCNPTDDNYTDGLNDLLRKMKTKQGDDFDFQKHFKMNTELITALNNLKQTHRLTLAIFTTDIIQNEPKAKAATNSTFDHTFSAKDMATKKTDPNAYKQIASELGVDPNQILFFDDTQANLTAAHKAGLQIVHFESNNQLTSHLQFILSNHP